MEDEATHIGLTNLNRILNLPCFSDVVHPDEGRYSTNGIFKCERWIGKKKHSFYCAVTEESIPMPSHTRLTKRRRVIHTTPRITRGRSKASLVSPDEGGNSQTKMPLLGKDIFSQCGSMRIGRKRLAASIKNKVDVSFVQPGIQEWLHSERGLEYLRLYSSERQRALEADILMSDGVSVTRPQHEDTSNWLHLDQWWFSELAIARFRPKPNETPYEALQAQLDLFKVYSKQAKLPSDHRYRCQG